MFTRQHAIYSHQRHLRPSWKPNCTRQLPQLTKERTYTGQNLRTCSFSNGCLSKTEDTRLGLLQMKPSTKCSPGISVTNHTSSLEENPSNLTLTRYKERYRAPSWKEPSEEKSSGERSQHTYCSAAWRIIFLILIMAAITQCTMLCTSPRRGLSYSSPLRDKIRMETGGASTTPNDPDIEQNPPPTFNASTIQNPNAGSELVLHTSQVNNIDRRFAGHWRNLKTITWTVGNAKFQKLLLLRLDPGSFDEALKHVSQMYLYWRGTFEVAIMVNGTWSHAGKLIMCQLPPDIDPNDIYDLTTVDWAYIDVHEKDTVAIRTQDISRTFYHKVNSSETGDFGGYFVLAVLSKLETTTGGPATVDIQVLTRTGPDFMFSYMVPPRLSITPVSSTYDVLLAFTNVDNFCPFFRKHHKLTELRITPNSQVDGCAAGVIHQLDGTLTNPNAKAWDDHDFIGPNTPNTTQSDQYGYFSQLTGDDEFKRVILHGKSANSCYLGLEDSEPFYNDYISYSTADTQTHPVKALLGLWELISDYNDLAGPHITRSDYVSRRDTSTYVALGPTQASDMIFETTTQALGESIVLHASANDPSGLGVLSTSHIDALVGSGHFAGLPTGQTPIFRLKDRTSGLVLMYLRLNQEGYFSAPYTAAELVFQYSTIEMEYDSTISVTTNMPTVSNAAATATVNSMQLMNASAKALDMVNRVDTINTMIVDKGIDGIVKNTNRVNQEMLANRERILTLTDELRQEKERAQLVTEQFNATISYVEDMEKKMEEIEVAIAKSKPPGSKGERGQKK
ncbi:TPA_asm: capsid protein precursor [Apostichopus japonicus associated picornavirus 1]|nr:TPA_asm: capsid protein precursor [Apostichopus japonicus associated picornavirus 1]